MTIALKEIHIENSKKRDASIRFVSLIRENDPKLAYKGKAIKNSRLLISSDETSEDSLINKYKSKLTESILKSEKNYFALIGRKTTCHWIGEHSDELPEDVEEFEDNDLDFEMM